jgi:transcription termination factor NusB
MIQLANQYLDKIKNTSDKSEKKVIADEFKQLYNKLSDEQKSELKPFFEELRLSVSSKINHIDNLINQSKTVLENRLA